MVFLVTYEAGFDQRKKTFGPDFFLDRRERVLFYPTKECLILGRITDELFIIDPEFITEYSLNRPS
jgi:hypothetical protein